MLLENKNAIVYGAAGAIGGAVARAYGRDGARVFLAGRTLATLEEVDRGVPSLGRGRRDQRRDGESHLWGHHRLIRLAGRR